MDTPKTVTQEERAAAAAAGPGSPEHTAVKAFDDAAAAAIKAEAEGKTVVKDEVEAEAKPSALLDDELTLGDKDKPTAEEEAPASDSKVAIPATGNKVVDDVAQLLVDKNIPNADKVIAEFAENGELSLAAQAVLVDGLGESVAALALQQLNSESARLKDKGKAERTELLTYTNEKFNGTDQDLTWSQMTEFARSPEAGFSEDDIAAMNGMLKKGGLQGKLVVDKIAEVYFASSGTTSQADLLEGDTYAPGKGFTPISRKEYTDKLRDVMRDYGEGSVQARQLDKQRELSIASGY